MLSVFAFIDPLVGSASQDEGGYAISRQNYLELYLVAIPVKFIESFYLGMPVVRTDGPKVT